MFLCVLFITLTILHPVQAPYTDDYEIACVGGKILLPCKPIVTRDKGVVWKYNQTELVYKGGLITKRFRQRFAVETFHSRTYNLTIRDVLRSDAGFYDCIEDDGHGVQHRVQLYVSESYCKLDRQTAVAWQNFTFPYCRARKPTWMYWRKPDSWGILLSLNGRIIGSSQSRFAVDLEAFGHYNLTNKCVQKTDAGIYKCTNGSDTHGILLGVETNGKQSQLDACIGQNVTLHCTACLPDAQVGWVVRRTLSSSRDYMYTNGQIYKRYKDRFSVDQRGSGVHDLIIGSVWEDDSGIYDCYDDGHSDATPIRRVQLNVSTDHCLMTTTAPMPERQHSTSEAVVSLHDMSPLLKLRVFTLITAIALVVLLCTATAVVAERLCKVQQWCTSHSQTVFRGVDSESLRVRLITSSPAAVFRGVGSGSSRSRPVTSSPAAGNYKFRSTTSDAICHRWKKLQSVIEPDFGLLNHLLSHDVLSRDQYSKIDSGKTVYERNDQLLTFLSEASEEQCQGFLSALKQTGQEHVANFICKHDTAPEMDLIRPLDDGQVLSIERNFPQLVTRMNTTDSFLGELASVDCITHSQMCFLMEEHSMEARNKKLLDIMMRRSVKDCYEFHHCLRSTGQADVASLFHVAATAATASDGGSLIQHLSEERNSYRTAAAQSNTSSSVQHQLTEQMDSSGQTVESMRTVRENLSDLSDKLIRIIEPDYELLDELFSMEVLSREQCADIRSEKTVYKRNERLLVYLGEKNVKQLQEFLAALKKTNQQHVVNYVATPVTVVNMGADQPLDEMQLRRICATTPRLVELLNLPKNLLQELHRIGCLTWLQEQHLHQITIPAKRNRILLDILTRKSVGNFDKFVEVLSAGGQAHLVPMLREPEVTTPNEKLRRKFQKLHTDMVESFNPDSAIDFLFENDNLSADDLDRLQRISRPRDQCRQLMTLLHNSRYPESFVKLRLAIKREPAYSWLVDKLDNTPVVGDAGSDAEEQTPLLHAPQAIPIDEGDFDNVADVHQDVSCGSQEVAVMVTEEDVADVHQDVSCGSQEVAVTATEEGKLVHSETLNYLVSLPLTADHLTDLPWDAMEIVLRKTAKRLFKALAMATPRPDIELFHTLSLVFGGAWLDVSGRKWNTKQLCHNFKRFYKSYLWRPQWQESLLIRGNVSGVAHLDNKIYVTVDNSDEIHVFSSCYDRLQSILVRGMSWPRDIIGCQETGQLYVSERKLLRIVSTCKEAAIGAEKDPIETKSSILGLSMTDNRLLVTMAHSLLLIETSGEQSTVLPIGIRVVHAVETKNSPTTFIVIVSHVSDVLQYGVSKTDVSEIALTGELIRSCSEHFSLPYHLALVGDRVLVADKEHHRILVLNSELQVERLLASQDNGLYKPSRMCFVPNTGCLWLVLEIPDAVQKHSNYCRFASALHLCCQSIYKRNCCRHRKHSQGIC